MPNEDIQLSILRTLSPEKKLDLALRLYHSARELKAAWLRQQHGDWTERQVMAAVREAFVNARS